MLGKYNVNKGLTSKEFDLLTFNSELNSSFKKVQSNDAVALKLSHSFENLSDVIESLDSLATDSIALSDQAMAFLKHSVQEDLKGTVSVESILPKDINSLLTLNVSIENLKDALQKMWVAIREAVKKTLESLSNFFSKIFDNLDSIIKKLENMKETSKKIKSDNLEIKNRSGLAVKSPDSVKFSGKVSYDSMSKGLKALKFIVTETYVDYTKVLESDLKNQINLIKKMDKVSSEEEFKPILETMESSSRDVLRVIKTSLEGKFIIGDKVFKNDVKHSSNHMFNLILSDTGSSNGFRGEVEIDPLTPDQMSVLLSLAISSLETIKNNRKTIDSIRAYMSESIRLGELLAKSSSDDKSIVRNRTVLRKLQQDNLRPVTQLTTHFFNTIRSLVTIVEESTRLYIPEEGTNYVYV
ncbi:MAG: hypothetical protein IBX57_00370 [Gammaproteobacteria bacterium]|nr:hypothetical protein [Gammaproteobacteria bacterium]